MYLKFMNHKNEIYVSKIQRDLVVFERRDLVEF